METTGTMIFVLLANRFTSKWWFSSPTPVDRAQDDIKNLCEMCLCVKPGLVVTFAFCRTFPLEAPKEAALGFSTEAEMTDEAASKLL